MELSSEHIKQLKKGNLEIFEQIYDNMFESLCLYGGKIIQENDVVRDAVQEAFIALWNKKLELDNIFKIKAYLYTIVRNKLITHIRLKKTVSFERLKVEIEDNELCLQVFKEETYKVLNESIANLPHRTQLVMLCKLQGLTNKQIADKLCIKLNTVKTLQRAGYSNLREQLKDNALVLLILAELFSR